MLSEEQEELRRIVRSLLAPSSPRATMETGSGYDPVLWRRMAGELGLHGLAIPEEHGGMGFSWVELALAFEEMGRALYCGPFLSSVGLAAGAVLAAGDGLDLLAGIASGEVIATLAVCEASGRWDEAGVRCEASGAWVLNGEKWFVLDGHVADLILVAARGPDGVGLFAVDGGAPGLSRHPQPTMDLTRRLARLTFASSPARLIGRPGGGWAAVEAGLALGCVALAAAEVGGAQRCLDLSVEHARTRHQFGRPIGTFQGVKHKCADDLLQLESARSTATHAAWAASQDDAHELAVASSLAKVACSEAYLKAAADCIQIHGAMGFTWEHDAHLYFKRAKSSALLFGDPTWHRGLLADHLGL